MLMDSKDMPKVQQKKKALKCRIMSNNVEPIQPEFVSIVAWASYQRAEDKTPYWRTLKANGELNANIGGIEAQ